MNKIKISPLILIGIVAICISLHSCENSTRNSHSSTESTSHMKENDNIYNKVEIVRTKKEITYSMRYLSLSIKNISNEDLGGKSVPIMVRYEDGTVERTIISTPTFRPGDTESWSIKSKENGFGSIEAISCELTPN